MKTSTKFCAVIILVVLAVLGLQAKDPAARKDSYYQLMFEYLAWVATVHCPKTEKGFDKMVNVEINGVLKEMVRRLRNNKKFIMTVAKANRDRQREMH